MVLAQERAFGKSLRMSDTKKERFYYLARRVTPSNATAMVRLALPEAHVRQTQGTFLLSAIGLSLVSLLAISALSYFGTLLLIRPVERIANAAESVAGGEFDYSVPRVSTHELDRLSVSISNMRDSLVNKIGELETRQALFDSMVSGMRGGVIVLDQTGTIRLANQAALPILRVESEPTGRPLAQVVRNQELAGLVATTLEDGVERNQRIRSPGDAERYFDVYISPLVSTQNPENAGALVLLYDITRIEALEELRKKFVANLSHELRTPLTSIQAAASTLVDGAIDDDLVRDRFLGTITRNAERMTALLSDLTDLSRIETGAISLKKEPVDVCSVIRDVAEQLEPKFAHLNLGIEFEIEQPLVLSVDPIRFEQIIVNLLDNAMKFNREGGWVRITGSGKMLRVSDSGPGIPEKNRSKIFHRFFRLDPARSLRPGGTGLGLAIVKHLMTLHGGSIWVESTPDEGSTFVLDFS